MMYGGEADGRYWASEGCCGRFCLNSMMMVTLIEGLMCDDTCFGNGAFGGVVVVITMRMWRMRRRGCAQGVCEGQTHALATDRRPSRHGH